MPWKGKPFGWQQPRPLLDYLPEPSDASVNVLRQVTQYLAEGKELGELKVSVNYLEPPSNQLAAQLQFRAYNSPIELKVKFAAVPKPDPRKSSAKFKLWKYRFKQARPAVTGPPAVVSTAIAELAAQEYDFARGWQQAAQVAQQLSPASVADVLAVMVHPPPVTDGVEAWVWLPRVQLAAAQVAAQKERTSKTPVSASLLRDVAIGPIDWTTDAAVIAITQWAREDESQSDTARQLFGWMMSNKVPSEGAWAFIDTLLHCWLLLPTITDAEKTELQSLIAEREH